MNTQDTPAFIETQQYGKKKKKVKPKKKVKKNGNSK
jgi:hypothetical protein